MASNNTINHTTIKAEIRDPLTKTEEEANTYQALTREKFSGLGAIVAPLAETVKDTADSIKWISTSADTAVKAHPAPQKNDVTAILEDSTKNRTVIDPDMLIGGGKDKTKAPSNPRSGK